MCNWKDGSCDLVLGARYEKNVRKASGDCEEGGYVSLAWSLTGTALQSVVLQSNIEGSDI